MKRGMMWEQAKHSEDSHLALKIKRNDERNDAKTCQTNSPRVEMTGRMMQEQASGKRSK